MHRNGEGEDYDHRKALDYKRCSAAKNLQSIVPISEKNGMD